MIKTRGYVGRKRGGYGEKNFIQPQNSTKNAGKKWYTEFVDETGLSENEGVRRKGGGNMPVVYIDVLFLINMGIDAMVLWCSTKIAGVRTRWWRIVAASAVGGIYAVCIFFPKLSALSLLAAKAAVSVMMVCIAFWVNSWRALLRALAAFYVTGFVFGGGITGIVYLTGMGSRLGTVVSNGSIYFNLPWKLLVLTATAVCGILRAVVRYLKKFLIAQGILGKLRMSCLQKTTEVTVLLDTGNQLKDPLSGKPVAVVELTRLRPLMQTEIYNVFEQCRMEELYEVLPYEWTTRLRMIPYNGVGVENGMLVGIVPDKTELRTQEENFRECDCIVAVYPGKLKCANGSGGIVNPSLLV